ncbi:hypothetical protein CEP54_007227 [Fusarium duplospermum]|uniref:Uncharacterized protein n=1 Tax=Fusarium duplospermum TaxID=1325734 RepID=A0A428Q2M4_9HYPO|nr:hypothetical protein CEP54_007227 [Fusarium duplospermum]
MRFLILAVILGLIAGTRARAIDTRSSSIYSVEIPSSAVVVSDWDSLHKEGVKYPDAALVHKYGGWVIEVDDVIVLAVEGSLVQEITEMDPEAAEEDDCEKVEEEDESGKLNVYWMLDL